MTFLKKLIIDPLRFPDNEYPYNVPLIKDGAEISFTTNVSFIVGENGSGKSTVLEGLAHQCGFNLSGGSRNHYYDIDPDIRTLSSAMRLSWLPKVTEGFFMRAESFYNLASYVD